MNVARLNALADLIEKTDPANFSMENWWWQDVAMEQHGVRHTCGTPACIAGWAIAMKHCPEKPAEYDVGFAYLSQITNDVLFDAADYLGLDYETADELMMQTSTLISAADAVKVIRHLAKTGIVDWEGTEDE